MRSYWYWYKGGIEREVDLVIIGVQVIMGVEGEEGQIINVNGKKKLG